MINNTFHQTLLPQIQACSSQNVPGPRFNAQRYLGTTQKYYNLKAKQADDIVRGFVKQNGEITLEALVDLLDSLSKGESHEERSLRGRLLNKYPKLRAEIPLEKLDYWLGYTNGWAEVDVICQSVFTAKEILANWGNWEKLLRKLSKDGNVHKRRASLVLLTMPVRHSPDKRLADLSFENIIPLMKEKNILITKAISWLLRHLIKNHREEVKAFLNRYSTQIPLIAIRETKRKLLTGRK